MSLRLITTLLTALLVSACTATVGEVPANPGAGDGDGDADGDGNAPDRDGNGRPDDLEPGDDCGPCPAPGECRGGECVQPAADGAWCEFDDECEDTELCIAARCTPDCRLAGNCACENNDACDNGFLCQAGQCVPDGGDGACMRDDECPDGNACIDGACQGPGECNVDHPDLEGTWDVRSELRLREALPGFVDGFLAATAEPFRFLAGQSDDLGLDIPILEDLIEDEVRDWADDNLPEWSREMMGAIADLNDILSTMQVRQRWELEGSGVLDEYTGEETWTSIAFTFRGEDVEGRPEDVLGWDVSSSTFTAHASCGVLYIDRYDVDAAIGAIIAWMVDTLVWIVSDGQYENLAQALFDFEDSFCPGVADAADDLSAELGGPDVYDEVLAVCDVTLARLIDEALEAINDAMLELTVLRLQGRADITDRDTLSNGHWAGTLAGGDFTGDFSASRR